MPQDLLVPFEERQQRTVRAEDLDMYKTCLLQVLRKTNVSLNDFKQQYQNKYEQHFDRNKKNSTISSVR